MKNIFAALLMVSSVNAFAITDVCVIGQQLGVDYEQGNSYCISVTTKVSANSVIARCSMRTDNITIDFRRTTWIPKPGTGICGTGIPQQASLVEIISSMEQAQADTMAELYQKGYVLFDSKTMLRTR